VECKTLLHTYTHPSLTPLEELTALPQTSPPSPPLERGGRRGKKVGGQERGGEDTGEKDWGGERKDGRK